MEGSLINRIRWVALGIVLILILILIFQNTEGVTLRFFLWDIAMPKLVLMALCLLAGLGAGFGLAKLPRDR